MARTVQNAVDMLLIPYHRYCHSFPGRLVRRIQGLRSLGVSLCPRTLRNMSPPRRHPEEKFFKFIFLIQNMALPELAWVMDWDLSLICDAYQLIGSDCGPDSLIPRRPRPYFSTFVAELPSVGPTGWSSQSADADRSKNKVSQRPLGPVRLVKPVVRAKVGPVCVGWWGRSENPKMFYILKIIFYFLLNFKCFWASLVDTTQAGSGRTQNMTC